MSRIAEQAYGDYPERPGWKEPTTSREAARSMESTAGGLRQDVYRAIAGAPDGLTADEAAKAVGASILAVRPRVSELVAEKSIVDAGMTRKNESNRNAKVWRAA